MLYELDLMIIIFAINMILLLIPHSIADWMVQRDNQAINKITHPNIRLDHSLEYGVIMTIAFLAINGLQVIKVADSFFYVIVAIFSAGWFCLSHYYLDDRKIVNWWISKIKDVSKNNKYL